MVNIRVYGDDGRGRARGPMAKVAGLALGVALFGTVGLSGALAQADDVTVGAADAESIIAAIFAEIFGGGVADEDESTISGGDINVGGNMGSNVTMGGGTGGGITIGGGSGGLTVGDDSGG